jgi:uncharacterized iron-regulated membrane protein
MNRRIYVLRLLRRWHGRIGVLAAAFFLFLALTGIALNHTAALDLDAHRYHSEWLARWYGIPTEPRAAGYELGNDLLVAANGRWLLGNRVFAEGVPEPLGIAESNGVLYVATERALHVYLRDGRRVEKISGKSLPTPLILAVGTVHSQIALQGTAGVYASPDGLAWKKIAAAEVAWSRPVAVPPSMRSSLAALLVPGVSAETLLLDIHSGRILGAWGPAFVDSIALILAALAISGVVVFIRSRRRPRVSHADVVSIESGAVKRLRIRK